ncbi:MAG: glycine C-acetyltransferase [Planctomycetes bacterium]|jgi:glycine C-acetyltransferase|nr:glycine C-acetyltransferase [Planctomycetota bacterium]MBT6452181.1 glycine C-acetyltransferase [Planctomycetota bacterium]MBT6540316.1 glycine C-acetyltransferase [Planctomycetota bacterium]MBT6783998.1 glycine C-acetyltransferase [Planctomycetota bacterium]MBT6967792.1 glycine C-acetyltransferase [Planctomycetota bacterium]
MFIDRERFVEQLQEIEDSGLWKQERLITGPQGAKISTLEGEALNFCANNYLGLSSHPAILETAHAALDSHGFGLSSVRFICGTQDIHKQLEQRISTFLSTEDSILYTSCFDANGGLFETLLGPEDAVISDELNHASIIDGVRLCKAKRFRYSHANMSDLQRCLTEASDARTRMVVTDGVFSMHGDLAPLDEVAALCDEHHAILVVDDSHSTGFIGKTGRGTAEHFGVQDRVDLITSTLGKALGGASGGFTTGRKELIELLRQRSRPYLFSNTLAPAITAAGIRVLDLIDDEPERVQKSQSNTLRFRQGMTAAGFDITPGIHPIVPIMLGDERKTMEMAEAMNQRGIFVVGFSYPVVPRGQARIRVQISAGHEIDQIDHAITVFTEVGKDLGLLN